MAEHHFRAITLAIAGALMLYGCSIEDTHPAPSRREYRCEAGNLYSQHDVGGDPES
jgi:hypothetical protein